KGERVGGEGEGEGCWECREGWFKGFLPKFVVFSPHGAATDRRGCWRGDHGWHGPGTVGWGGIGHGRADFGGKRRDHSATDARTAPEGRGSRFDQTHGCARRRLRPAGRLQIATPSGPGARGARDADVAHHRL